MNCSFEYFVWGIGWAAVSRYRKTWRFIRGYWSEDIRFNQLMNFSQSRLIAMAEGSDQEIPPPEKRTTAQQRRTESRATTEWRCVIVVNGNLTHHMARCCQPIPGDDCRLHLLRTRFIAAVVNSLLNCCCPSRTRSGSPLGGIITRGSPY